MLILLLNCIISPLLDFPTGLSLLCLTSLKFKIHLMCLDSDLQRLCHDVNHQASHPHTTRFDTVILEGLYVATFSNVLFLIIQFRANLYIIKQDLLVSLFQGKCVCGSCSSSEDDVL